MKRGWNPVIVASIAIHRLALRVTLVHIKTSLNDQQAAVKPE